jgi:hypothetical protein
MVRKAGDAKLSHLLQPAIGGADAAYNTEFAPFHLLAQQIILAYLFIEAASF